MPDMLVKLYRLPPLAPVMDPLTAEGIRIRRAHLDEKHGITHWVEAHFGHGWAMGCEIAIAHRPVTCYIAVALDQSPIPCDDPYAVPAELLIGFALYDVGAKGLFGPIGVREDYRGRDIGMGLLLRSLHTMADDGYDYAVIGQVGPAEFYEKTVGAVIIEDSERKNATRNLGE